MKKEYQESNEPSDAVGWSSQGVNWPLDLAKQRFLDTGDLAMSGSGEDEQLTGMVS